jgi:hypothetical protein
MTTEQLAKQVLDLLKLQQDYFQRRTPAALSCCKDAERRLRRQCENILDPPQPGLFDEAPKSA